MAMADIIRWPSIKLFWRIILVTRQQGRRSRGGGGRGNCPPPIFPPSQWDGYACAPPPKFWQSLGISTFNEQKNRSRAPARQIFFVRPCGVCLRKQYLVSFLDAYHIFTCVSRDINIQTHGGLDHLQSLEGLLKNSGFSRKMMLIIPSTY